MTPTKTLVVSYLLAESAKDRTTLAKTARMGHTPQLQLGRWRYGFNNSGLIFLRCNYDPQRPYQFLVINLYKLSIMYRRKPF